ncbi:hypothetical protein F503_04786 [Ophiostoma piceae UAMH 11346]|uniref:Uncharacterized protein n=1 Tax=Ophiostoma piceae (strain UAMH 11346) TaxID=1262450 RepID=S3CCA0_OPHP1|nr:hypothetical protein F503_04786 [Ophiostoma piceae UAMH 11346]
MSRVARHKQTKLSRRFDLARQKDDSEPSLERRGAVARIMEAKEVGEVEEVEEVGSWASRRDQNVRRRETEKGHRSGFCLVCGYGGRGCGGGGTAKRGAPAADNG